MKSLNASIQEYKKQLAIGDIKVAYRGLLDFMMQLRTHLQKKYPDHHVSGSIYQGVMDFSFLAFTPESLKKKKLKVIILLNHEDISLEVWLCGYNKQAQKTYWEHFRKNGWNKYFLQTNIREELSIVEYTITEHPDFEKPEVLIQEIEKEVLVFIEEVEGFLAD